MGNLFLAINRITEDDVRFNRYSKFQALNWLRLYYYTSLNYNIEDFANAEKLIRVSEELLKVIEGTDYYELHNTYSLYGDIVIASLIIEDSSRLIQYERKILNLLNSSDYATKVELNLSMFYYTLHKLKMFYEFNKDYEKAKFYAFQNAELTKYLYGEISVEHEQELRSYQTIIQLKQFNYEEAYKISLERENIIKSLFGVNSKEYLDILYQQSNIRLNQFKNKKELKILEKAIKISKNINCQNSKICDDIWFSYLDCLNSNQLYNEVLVQTKDLIYAENYSSLFRISKIRRNSYMGLKQFINVNFEYEWLLERISGKENILMEDRNSKVNLLYFILDYQEYLRSSGRLYNAISITEKYLVLFNDLDSDLARIDFNLGYLNILFQQNQCEAALRFVDDNIILKFSEITTPQAKALKEYSFEVTLGNIYSCLEKYPEAIKAYEKAIEYNGIKTNHLYLELFNLYNLTGNQKKAKKYLNEYEKSIINLETLDLHELALIADIFVRNNEPKKSLKYLLPLSDKVIDEICQKAFFSSKDNQSVKATHDSVLRFILTQNYGENYDSKLASNAVIISNLYKRKLEYYTQINLEIQKLKISDNQDAIKLEKLEKELNNNPSSIIEEEIGQIKTKLISSNLFDLKGLCNVSFQDIYKSINENEIVINLLSYKYNLASDDDFAINFNVKELSFTSTLVDLDNHFRLDKKENINSSFFDYVNEKVFQKEKVKGKLINTVYIIPSGKSNLINFSAFSHSLEEKLNRKIKVHVINSLTDITKIKNEKQNKIDNLILIGDIDYDKGDNNAILNNGDLTRGVQLTNSIENSGIPTWSYLPGTKQEIENIAFLGKENNINTSILKGKEVTESNLKKIIIDTSKNNVIHVATHGYFFPDNDDEKTESLYSTHKNPLLRSGLILSGANENWNNKSLIDSNNDGILTAEEISFMNLSGIELIVLSACDTGLGEVSNLEGVNGLQRAFKLAGANKLIMSLWKVPDKETAEFFDYFYEFLLTEKLSINDAFRKTQKVMNEKYKPYYWASFVLLE